jgi:hypothetical protein
MGKSLKTLFADHTTTIKIHTPSTHQSLLVANRYSATTRKMNIFPVLTGVPSTNSPSFVKIEFGFGEL